MHAVFGGRAARLLTALIGARLVPDGSVANVTRTPDAEVIRDEADQRKQIERFVGLDGHDRTASAVEPEMAEVFEQMDRYRMANMRTYARWIAAHGPLRVSTRRAGETMWALASPDVARMLCDELGWTQAQHARWLADTLARALLPDSAG